VEFIHTNRDKEEMIINRTDKQALNDWQEFLQAIKDSTTIDLNETAEEKAKRMKELEKDGNQEAWFKYYFPKYSFAEAASFHKKSTRKVLKANRLFQCRVWARGLSKSTRRMFEVFYKTFAQKFPTNMLLMSKTEGNASRLLAPYKANLEANQRITNDYGDQVRLGSWTESEFITRGGHAFRAVGAEQNPRGSKVEERRPNVLVFDDLDDDEVSLNPERVDRRWKWCQEAVFPTVDISRDYFIFFDNNLIAEDSCCARAMALAHDVDVINIRDESGESVWKEKNSEQDIDDMLSIISYESQQKEYFNNPISEGKTFKEETFGKCPPLKSMDFVITYADPATSNKDKPTAKSKAKNSCKAVFVVGYKDLKFFVYKGFLDNTSNSNFIDWLYQCNDYVGGRTTNMSFIENNTLQNPFYEQVLLPLIMEKGKQKGFVLPVSPDERSKPEKWTRIEGNLEPLWRNSLLVLNIDEKDCPHMKRLIAQFKAASATAKTMDGPDCIEGAVHIIKSKVAVEAARGIQVIKRRPNNKRY
jgi:hypothetical protein